MEDLSSDNYVFAYAGQNDTGITVTIGSNVTKIPAYLFNSYISNKYAPNITSVTFETGSVCVSIGQYAFRYCSNLENITIPASVTNFYYGAFYECTSLTDVYYSGTASQWASISFSAITSNPLSGNYIGIDNPTTKVGNLYLNNTLATNITFENITTINAYSFAQCTSLTSVVIPASVTSIGAQAFSDCTALANVTIGSGVKTIGNYAFAYCDALTGINFNATAMNDLSSGNRVFYYAGYENGIEVNIGTNVTKIPAYLFYSRENYLTYVTTVVFENSSTCQSIGNYAFTYCTYLTSITIPDSVTSIGDGAFLSCTLLTSVTFENTSGWYVTQTENATSGDNVTLTSTDTNATYLTDTYKNYYWYRTNS